MAEEVTANVISELISDLTIHITTYDTCVYVDKSVDFVDYSEFYTKKRQMIQKWCIIAKEPLWRKNQTVLK